MSSQWDLKRSGPVCRGCLVAELLGCCPGRRRSVRAGFSRSRPAEAGPHADRPPAALLERFHERAESLLLEVGFLHENNPDRIYDDLRAIAGRAELDAREVTILLGILRQIEWKLGDGR